MKKRLLEKNIFNDMKIPQYEGIPIVKDMEWPECHKSDINGFSKDCAKPVGWCDTQNGFMAIFECQHCFAKFRCHINSTGRYSEESFYQDFELMYFLYDTRKNNN